MRASLTMLLLGISINAISQKIQYLDFPKVDGEYNVNPSRKTMTSIPKAKCTKLNSFGYSNSKSIYFDSDKVVQNKVKANDFQAFQFIIPIDKSIREWHARMFTGQTIPTLDFYTDLISINQTEISHIKLTNVKLTSIEFNSYKNKIPFYTITVNYEKINYSSSEWNSNGTIKAISQSCFDLKKGIPCTETL